MTPANHTLARLAGLHYLVLITTGLSGMVYVPAAMFDWSSPIQTGTSPAADATLFRWGVYGYC